MNALDQLDLFAPELRAAIEQFVDERVAQAIAQLDHGERSPEYMGARGAAHYLGVSVERVRKLKDRRALPYYQEAANCRVLFKRSDLDAFMAELRVEARRPR